MNLLDPRAQPTDFDHLHPVRVKAWIRSQRIKHGRQLESIQYNFDPPLEIAASPNLDLLGWLEANGAISKATSAMTVAPGTSSVILA